MGLHNWRPNAALNGRCLLLAHGFPNSRLETSIKATTWRLALQVMKLLQPLIRDLMIIALLLESIVLCLLLLQPRAILQHLLDLLGMSLLTGLSLLSRKWLTRRAKLAASSAVAEVQTIHDARDLFFTNMTKRADTGADST